MKKLLEKLKGLRQKKHYGPFVDVIFFCLAFFATFLAYVLIYKLSGFYPFDEKGLTTLMSDQRDQYVAYMRTYQYALKHGESLVYSLSKVFGGDFQSLFTYYLASPFNLFVVFISSAEIPAFFFYTSIIKMSFASANMYLLARYMTKKRRVGYLAFSFAYGLISYAFIYMFNFMFLDGLMILPLVTLGLKAIEKGEKLWIYPLSLGYALMTSWYIGAMICIYAVIFFVLRFAFMDGGIRERLKYLMRFAIFSLLGGLLVSFTWLCAFLHFAGTKATLTLPDSSFFNWAIFFEGLLENNYLSTKAISRNEGYMTMFVSVITLLFALTYFGNKKYSWREKVGDGAFILVYFVVSLSSVLNALFHGGRVPTWFPGRYSFIIGFYLCYMALKEMGELEDTPIWSLAIPVSVSAILLPILCLVQKNCLEGDKKETLYPLSVISLALFLTALTILLLYFLFLLLSRKKEFKWKKYVGFAIEIAIFSLTAISSIRGATNVIDVNKKENDYQSYQTYLSDDNLSPVFEAVKERDSSFYRMEANFNRNGSGNEINNNPSFYSYNGLSHFSSTEKSNIGSYMRRIGFHNNGFWEAYDSGSTEAMNSFLGIKYLIDDGEDSADKANFIYNESEENLYKKMEMKNTANGIEYSYYENKSSLPLGFVVDSSSSTYVSQGERREGHEEIYWYDHFEYQNEMYKRMNASILDEDGKKKDIFHKIESTVTLNDEVMEAESDEFGRKTYVLTMGARITFKFVIPSEANGNTLYIHEQSENGNLNYILDGSLLGMRNYWHAGIHSFNADVGTSHAFTIAYTGLVPRTIKLNPEIYYEDLSVLQEYLTAIRSGGANDLRQTNGVSSTTFEGEFELKGEDKEFLFTLPYESNFSLYIDGKKRDTMTRFDIFVAASLDGLSEGKHTVKLVYNDKGLTAGIVVSVISLAGFIPLVIFYGKIEAKIFKKKEKEPTDADWPDLVG